MSTEFLIPKFMDEPLFVHDSASEIDIIRKIHLFLQKGKNPSSRWRSKAKLKYGILPAMCFLHFVFSLLHFQLTNFSFNSKPGE